MCDEGTGSCWFGVAVGVGEASGGEVINLNGAEGDKTVMGVGETTTSDA
jgi:hypothetical protein